MGETVQVGRMQWVWSSKSSSLLGPISIPQRGNFWCPDQQRLHYQDCSSASKHAAAARPHAPSYAFCRFCCPGQPLVLALYQTLHAACSVLGRECNRQAWATRTGLQEPCGDRAFARRRHKWQSGIRTEKEREKLRVTSFCGCLFIIYSVLGILLVVVDMLHGGVTKSPNCPRS